ncbi:MAG: hypothetical protein O2895_04755 [Chloroflexi bacterium]|nr:hypothetical protein [Chloroflexota bacterium]
MLAVVLSACFDLRTLEEQHADAIEDARRSAMAAGWMLGFAGTAVLALGRRAMWFVAPVVVVALLASSIAIDELDLAEYFRLLVEGS